jgi:maltose O-acetyltransferase
VFLDCAPIDIGDDLQMGPAAQLYAATHPLDRRSRDSGLQLARPIRIGNGMDRRRRHHSAGSDNCDGSVTGASSIVPRDLPPGSVVAGNPARIIRSLA